MYIQYITYHWICNTTFTVVFHKYPPPKEKKKKSNRTKATLHVPTQYTHSVNTQPQAHQLKPAITNSIHKHAQEVLFKEGIGHFLHQIPDFSFPLFFLSFFFFVAQKMRSLSSSKQLPFKVHFTLQQMSIAKKKSAERNRL